MHQSNRPTYTEDQILRYLEHVGKSERISRDSCDTEAGLEYLNRLIPLQQAKVPFENLDLHYSNSHHVSLDTELLFHKIVDRKAGRGGYCMQLNLFFATILRSMGYKVMPCGSRVSSSARVTDLDKISFGVNIVYIAGHKYWIDVGFGSNQPSAAIPLIDGWTGRPPWYTEADNMRLAYTHIAENTVRNEEQKLWIYQMRKDSKQPWFPLICFSETEFLPQDFASMNYSVSHQLTSFFTYSVIARRCLLDDHNKEMGEVTMVGGRFKETIRGESRILGEAKTEEERIDFLKEFFGIHLDASEADGIKGYITMLR